MTWKNKFTTKNKFYETDNGILYNGNCINILQTLPENSIDLVVTSPPYNVGIQYSDWDDTLSLENYFDFMLQFLNKIYYVLKKDGRFAINIPYDTNMKHKTNGRVSILCEFYAMLKQANLNYYTIVDLHEDTPHRIKYTAWGSWKSASAPYIYNPKEAILIGYKSVWKKATKGKSTLTTNEFKEITSGIWNYKAETHGLTLANYSLDLPIKAIKGLSYENDIILDPFIGSGTTAVAAEGLNRRWIGIEISKKYCKVFKKRLEKEQHLLLPFACVTEKR